MSTQFDIISLAKLSLNSCTGNSKEKNHDEFRETFTEVISAVPSLLKGKETEDGVANMMDWLKIAMIYNVPNGKQIRGRLFVTAYEKLVENPTEEQMRLARILGWIGEIMQAASLVADDIMDNGVTRRGSPCWYRVNNKGNVAFNDVLMLEHVAYQLLRKYFGAMEVHSELLNCILEVAFKTTLGQSLDTRIGQSANFDSYSSSVYKSIVIYKTAYYTIYLPVALAMILAGISSEKEEYQRTWETVEQITLKLGELFQIQDDYLDCFANETTLGKVGMDIEEGKCTWLFVTAKELCNEEEFRLLKMHYGSSDKNYVAMVKKLYLKLNLPNIYEKHQESLQEEIENLIENVDHPRLRIILFGAMEQLYKRKY